MVQYLTSSGGLHSPMAPNAGLAGTAYLRPPRGKLTRFPRRGMGAGSQTGEAAVATAGAAAGVALPLIGATAAIPFVGPIIALASLIFGFIGGGCGNACIESSQAEQIYEVAAEDLAAVAKLGMIGQADFSAGIQAIIQGGQQHLETLQQQGDASAASGLTNFNKATSTYSSFAATLPATAPNALNLTTAQAAFIQPGASGWYAASVTSGNQLALTYLQSLPAGGSSASGSVDVLGTTFSTTTLLWVAAGLGALFLFSGE